MDGPADSALGCGGIAPRDGDHCTGSVLDADARRGYLPRVGVSPSLLDIQELFHRISGDGREQVAGVDAPIQEPLYGRRSQIHFDLRMAEGHHD